MIDAVEYLKEKNRMCYRNSENQHCSICPFKSGCCQCEDDHPAEAVRIVEEWSKAHPKQTNADKFKEVFGFGHQGVGCNDCKIVYGDTWWDAPYEAPKGEDA